ncbi:hypothetical protein Mal4_24150 [Maioricimonas rarisocia]|uniref:Secreted protein n=1 Tax=Maioricimonas rarisocia TaxID=2528026 RepID=A0A517Z6N4_9PLAN|nr:hypothetical protein [Maioricimonas rarisocia]QDU38094.1 hypothetical protein Mal4_24150 [Maioricimonas rarisocia]
MPRVIIALMLLTVVGSRAMAQEEFVGPASVGSSEPLFSYDDLERWKHGYLQIMPYYGGYHSFRPYNYKQVISQSQTASGWGLSPTMPYSQQFWHYYEKQADLEAPALSGHNVPPATGHPDYGVVLQPAAGQTSSAPPAFNAPRFSAPQHQPQQFTGPRFSTPGAMSPSGVSPATFHQPQFAAPQFRAPAPANSRSSELQQYLQQGR